MEKFAPSHVGKGGFAPVMRLAGVIGLTGGFLYFYQRSSRTLPHPPISAPRLPTLLCMAFLPLRITLRMPILFTYPNLAPISDNSNTAVRFYGATENAREIEMDMKEMVGKVKAGEPLYGESKLTPHMQGVAARQSRYSALFMGTIPWFNFVNHNQHGVDTAKYYQQAERELEAERGSRGPST
jgi:hypothetical protein